MTKFQLIYDMSATDIYTLYQTHASISKILQHLGIKNDPRCRKLISEKIEQITKNNNHSITRRSKTYIWDVEHIRTLAIQSSSLSHLLRTLSLDPKGKNFKTLKTFCETHNITFANINRQYWTDTDVYCVDSKYNRQSLSRRIKRDNWLEHQCSTCHNTGTWNEKPLPLQVDHINGVNTDHRKENLRWLCPNCHAQTDTYGGKNNKLGAPGRN